MTALGIHHFPAQPASSLTNCCIVLVHGGALSGRMYKDVVPFLTSEGYEVFTPDLPGHGSSLSLGPFTIERSSLLLMSMLDEVKERFKSKIVLVGVSLGGQVVLDTLQRDMGNLVDAAIVSGVSVQPPDGEAQWEMPRMPTDEGWLKCIAEDVNKIPSSSLPAIQQESLAFTFNHAKPGAPLLLVVGENDIAMARRDFPHLGKIVQSMNAKSESITLQGAWHNHPIDIPERFAELVLSWARKVL